MFVQVTAKNVGGVFYETQWYDRSYASFLLDVVPPKSRLTVHLCFSSQKNLRLELELWCSILLLLRSGLGLGIM